MRIIITGPRNYTDAKHLSATLDQVHLLWGIGCLIHGACHLGGADGLADAWARERDITIAAYPVDHAILDESRLGAYILGEIRIPV